MNWEIIEGNWPQVRRTVQEQWGRLTNDQLDLVAGRRDQLVGALENSYGIPHAIAECEVKDWESRNRRLFDVAAHAERIPASGQRLSRV